MDIPSPPNYGGAIDMYYKIMALHQAGCAIVLHCFAYGGRTVSKELEAACETVFTYPRKIGIRGLHHTLPYIVSSRQSNELVRHLLADQSPILLEGVHCAALLHEPRLKGRFMMLRMHNVEADYYRQLAEQPASFLKKLYAYMEAERLRRFEKTLGNASLFLPIGETEYRFVQQVYPKHQALLLPPFHSFTKVVSLAGQGDYALYHGNLAVTENKQAALFLAKLVFDGLSIPLIIAGKHPDADILALQNKHIRVVANPSEPELNQLIQHAQVHVLPAFQNTGIKLKLLHALYAGRHLIANKAMLHGTGLDKQIPLAETPAEWQNALRACFEMPFTEADIKHRQVVVATLQGAQQMATWLALIPR